MKYSFMSFSTPDKSFEDMLGIARQYGYDGIEPRVDAGHAHGVEVASGADQRSTFRRAAADQGVEIACLATSLKVAATDARDTIAQARERIRLAADLGCPALRVFGGKLADGMSREDALGQCASTLGAVADDARNAGVTLCFETHDDWCDPQHVAAVLTEVDHPAIACNWDVLHPVRTRNATVDESFEALKPWIRHLHVHDNAGADVNLVPIGSGIVDHRRVVELMLQQGYDGFLSGEWLNWTPCEDHLPRELAQLKAYERGCQVD